MAGVLRHFSLVCRASTSRICSPTYTSRIIIVRNAKYWQRKMLTDLYDRRMEIGPEKPRHRSEFMNWNYESELFSFGKRLGEDFQQKALKTAFTHSSYIEKEEAKRRDAGLSDEAITVDLETNDQLAALGETSASNYIKSYLRHVFPALPEEGICAVHDKLMSTETLSHISMNLGTSDLALCADFPPEDTTLSTTLKAVIGALVESQGEARAQMFVQDFIITQLQGKLIDEMWDIVNPMGILAAVLKNQNRAAPEPRLLWATGASTVVAAYQVGIYSDKKLIGKAYGETVTIAEQMAARDSIRKIFGLNHNHTPLPFGKEGHDLKIDMTKTNPTLLEYTVQQLQ